jgi:hypothetical protein
MTTRKYSSRSQQTTLTASLGAADTTALVVSGSALLGGVSVSAGQTYTVVIDPDTALEEIIDVTAVPATNTLTIVRGIETGGTGQAHSAGAVVRHMAIGRDFREANEHIENTTTAHGLTIANVLETTDTNMITTTMLQASSVTTPKIADLNVTTGKLADGSVTTAKIADLNVTTGKLADSAVTSAKIADGTIVNADINSAAAIDKTKIAGTAVTVADTGTVTSTMIENGTITNTDINASAGIAYSKLSLTGSVTSSDIADGTIVNADISPTAGIALSKLATDPLARANHTGTQAASTISDFDTQVRTNRLDQMAAPSAAVSLNSQKVTNLATPTVSTDASTKGYVDTQITNLIGAAPSTLDTLAEISAAINSDPNLYATLNNGKLNRDGTQAMTGALPMGTFKITGMGDPTNAQDAATKNYVDTGAASQVAAAAASATAAAASAVAADASATSASGSATSATASASSATSSASSATASASAAATSATNAANSATAASNSASTASTQATNAANSASAASTSETNAASSASAASTSATNAAASLDSFDDRYLGAKASPPSTDNDGNALLTGALYWNTSTNKMYVWSGSAWAEISSSADIISYKYTVAGGATSVSGADDNGLTLAYTVGKEQVYINGVLQVRGFDYVATTGSSITGISAMLANDIVTVLAFTAFVVADTYTQAQADAKFFQTANAFLAGKNKIINGDFGIWQRGTSFAAISGGAYSADRWVHGQDGSGNVTISQQTFTPGTAPVAGYEGTYFLRAAVTTTGTATYLEETQRIEDVRTFAGQTVTLSFWAKADSARSSIVYPVQVFGTGGSGVVVVATPSITYSTSWARYSFTFGIPSVSGKTIGAGSYLGFNIRTPHASGSTLDIWGVQVEAGSIATPFQTASGGSIQGELAMCQRYYFRSTGGATYSTYGAGYATLTTEAVFAIKLPVTMRVKPTALDYGNLGADFYNVSNTTFTNLVLNATGSGVDWARVIGTVASGLTQYRAYDITNANNTAGFIGFSAEL